MNQQKKGIKKENKAYYGLDVNIAIYIHEEDRQNSKSE